MARSRSSTAWATAQGTASTAIVSKTRPGHGHRTHLTIDLFGWKDGVLQKALDARCSGNACKTLKTQTSGVSTKCSKKQSVHEDAEGWITELPGAPAVTFG